MKILIIKLGAIGDVLRTTSMLPSLREKYPDSNIHWITKKESIPLLENNRHIDKVIIIGEKVIDKDFDIIISLDDDIKACKVMSSLNYKKIIGAYIKDGKIVYTKDSAPWFDMGLISRFGKEKADSLKAKNRETYQKYLFEMLDVKGEKTELPILNLSQKELEFASEFSSKNSLSGLVIGINTGAGGRWKDKKLSVEKTIRLIDRLNDELDCKIILFGGPLEKERNSKIVSSVNSQVIDAGCDNTLMEFSSLVNLCDILVTSDSLAMHIGIALKKKVVAFFYPTSPWEIELYGRGEKVIYHGKDLCSYKTECDDPADYDVSEIVEAVKSLV